MIPEFSLSKQAPASQAFPCMSYVFVPHGPMLKSPQFTHAPPLVGSSEQDTTLLMGTKGAEGRGNIACLVQLALFLLVQPRTWSYFEGDCGDLQKSLQPQFPSFPKSISSTSWVDAVRRIDLVYPILLLTLEKTWILKLKYCERHRKKHPVFLRVFFSGWIPMKNTTVEGNVPPMRFYENNNSSENDWKWLRWSRKITVWFVFGNWFVLVMWRKLRL